MHAKCGSSAMPDASLLNCMTLAMRADMRMIAIAVDEHTARLERIEKRLGLVEA